MKILILATAILLTSSFAYAGAYSFYCTNAIRSVVIDKAEVRFSEDFIDSAMQVQGVEYKSRSLPMFSTDNPENPNTALRIEIVGRKTQLVLKDQTDDCGNKGQKDIFSANVVIKNAKGKVLSREVILCDASFFPGHCS